VVVQVKAINGSTTWQFDIRKFSDVQMDGDGKHQIIGGLQPEPFPGLMDVLVVLEEKRDRFFVLEWKELQDTLVRKYREYLSKHHFVRPRAPGSFHVALAVSDVERFEDQWHKILDRVPSATLI